MLLDFASCVLTILWNSAVFVAHHTTWPVLSLAGFVPIGPCLSDSHPKPGHNNTLFSSFGPKLLKCDRGYLLCGKHDSLNQIWFHKFVASGPTIRPERSQYHLFLATILGPMRAMSRNPKVTTLFGPLETLRQAVDSPWRQCLRLQAT